MIRSYIVVAEVKCKGQQWGSNTTKTMKQSSLAAGKILEMLYII